jgi:hypothetical protein
MPRTARLDIPGLLHHVIVRGMERTPIFRDDQVLGLDSPTGSWHKKRGQETGSETGSGKGVRFECGRARSLNPVGGKPTPEGWPATG